MTSYSGWFDEHGKIVSTTRPSRLSDVFGIRLGSYRDTAVLNEVHTVAERPNTRLRIRFGDRDIDVESPRFDDVDLRGASACARITGLDDDYPAVTVNEFGAGRAIYVAVPARSALLDAVLAEELERRGIRPQLDVPRRVIARRTDDAHALYVNLTLEARSVSFPAAARSLFSGEEFAASATLPPMGVEFVEFD